MGQSLDMEAIPFAIKKWLWYSFSGNTINNSRYRRVGQPTLSCCIRYF